MKKLENLLKDYKYGKLTSRKYVNYRNIPVTCLDVTEENAKIFNEILDNLKRLNLFKLVRTPSGGISKTVKNFRIPSYDYSTSNSGAELIILLVKGFYRIQFFYTLTKLNQPRTFQPDLVFLPQVNNFYSLKPYQFLQALHTTRLPEEF